jgi:hypothetical protein
LAASQDGLSSMELLVQEKNILKKGVEKNETRFIPNKFFRISCGF